MVRNSSSVPNASSIWVLIRSKCPSTLGVGSQPNSPPAFFTGPVCTPSIPIASNAAHSASSPSVPRKEVPGLVIMEMGYAVNHTDAFSMAARGSGLANGFCHMLPWPENCLANSTASESIDCSVSQST